MKQYPFRRLMFEPTLAPAFLGRAENNLRSKRHWRNVRGTRRACRSIVALTILLLMTSTVRGQTTREIVDDQLLINGKPFPIRGACGTDFMETAAAAGANAVRTWSTGNALAVLDKADSLGLKVMLGIWLPNGNTSYADPERFERRVAGVTEVVRQCKDHPALLMWGIGNELNDGNDGPDLWRCVGAISKAIHQIGPNQLTTTVLINAPPETIVQVKQFAPDLDLLCANTYHGAIGSSIRNLDEHWGKPFLFSEWGTAGPWSVPRTSWDARIEPMPTAKVKGLRSDYLEMQAAEKCLGSFVFTWDVFQNVTHTWHSIVLDSGQLTPQADVMQSLWTGTFPDNRAPMIGSLKINNRTDPNCRINAGESFIASVDVSDPDGDPITCQWFLYDGKAKIAGPFEGQTKISLTAPARRGLEYRVFCCASDGKGRASAANRPFMTVVENSPLVINGDFETGDRNGWNAWNNEIVASDSKSGTHAMRIKGGGGSARQLITGLSPDTAYRAQLWAKYHATEYPLNFCIKDYGGEIIEKQIGSPEYRMESLKFKTGPDSENATISIWKYRGPAAYIDDVTCVVCPKDGGGE